MKKYTVKERIYIFFVKKNPIVEQEYISFRQEFPRKRLKAWLFLIKLFITFPKGYRIKQRINKNNIKMVYTKGAESSLSKRVPESIFVNGLLGYDVVSFDIFDTLILRPFATPADLFIIIGHKLKCVGFKQIRMEAETKAREIAFAQNGNHEVSLYDIYEIIEVRTGIERFLGVRIELETEMEFCFSNPYMKRVFDLLIEYKKRIILVSDMYLPHELLIELLKSCGYINFEKLYVSCNYKTNKHTGGLFQNVLHELGSTTSIVHIGDNYEADVLSAKRMGLSAIYYKNVHEIGCKYRSDGLSTITGSLYMGIVNTHLHNGCTVFSPAYEYGFIYGGLYIVGFCSWIYRKAKEQGVQKIFFLSRDGDIYSRIFNIMYSDMPNEYFYWSRIANLKYSARYCKDDFLERIVKHKTSILSPQTLESCLKSANIDFLSTKLSEYKLKKTMILTHDIAVLFEKFLTDHWDEIVDSYESELEVLKKDLSEKLHNLSDIAIIDVGWIGSGARGLRSIIENDLKLNCNIHNWVAATRYATKDGVGSEILSGDLRSYIFSPSQNRDLYDLHINTNKHSNDIFFELITQACMPSFSGYTPDGKMSFDVPEIENYNFTYELQKGVEDFAKIFLKVTKENKYLHNISGFDAYCPFRMVIRDLEYFKNNFSEICFSKGVSDNPNEQSIETLGEIFAKLKL